MSQAASVRALALGAVILAAGRSSRMGRPKLLLPWCSTSILGHLLGQWTSLGAEQVTVVCAPGDQAIQNELDRLGFPADHRILNPAPERGMFSSLQTAALWPHWTVTLSHLALVLGDQPHVRLETLRRLLEFAALHPAQVCQPSRGARPRHPVILPTPVFRGLAASSAPTLKEFLGGYEPAACEVEDPGLDLDIDRPEDYERALALEALAHVRTGGA